MPAYTYPVSYARVQDVLDAFPAIGSVSNITSSIIHQSYMGPVQAEINGKVAKRYSLPIVGNCPTLSAIMTRESVYRIVVQRQLVTFPAAQQGRSPLQVQHADDQKFLQEVAEGKTELYTVNSDGSFSALIAADTTQMEVFSTTKDYNPTFGEGGSWYDQVKDTQKTDDFLNDREGRGI